MKSISYSKFGAIVLCLILTLLSLYTKPWKKQRAIVYDVASYYAYLPAKFIYQDLELNFIGILPKEEPFEGVWVNDYKGKRLLKYTMGLAYLYFPGFVIADTYTVLQSKYNRNGYSLPYQLALSINALLLSFFSIFLLRYFLSFFFKDKIIALLLFTIVLATNYLHYVIAEPGMSHTYSFFLVVLLGISVEKFRQQSQVKWLLIMALVLGLLVLIRPTNILFLVLPLWLNTKHLIRFWQSGKAIYLYLVFAIFLGILPFIPQMYYWKEITGQWIYYSYGEENFFFKNPHIWKGLFGFRKGLFIYTPILLFSIPGIYFLANQKGNKHWVLPISMILIFACWVLFSWWCWWYGGGFGMRAMIEFYPLFAILLGASFQILFNLKLKKLLYTIVCVCIGLNLFQTWQYSKTLIHWESMNQKAYFRVFLKTRFPENYDQLLKQPKVKCALKYGHENCKN